MQQLGGTRRGVLWNWRVLLNFVDAFRFCLKQNEISRFHTPHMEAHTRSDRRFVVKGAKYGNCLQIIFFVVGFKRFSHISKPAATTRCHLL